MYLLEIVHSSVACCNRPHVLHRLVGSHQDLCTGHFERQREGASKAAAAGILQGKRKGREGQTQQASCKAKGREGLGKTCEVASWKGKGKQGKERTDTKGIMKGKGRCNKGTST